MKTYRGNRKDALFRSRYTKGSPHYPVALSSLIFVLLVLPRFISNLGHTSTWVRCGR